jgi:hypothetical protein
MRDIPKKLFIFAASYLKVLRRKTLKYERLPKHYPIFQWHLQSVVC